MPVCEERVNFRATVLCSACGGPPGLLAAPATVTLALLTSTPGTVVVADALEAHRCPRCLRRREHYKDCQAW